MLTEISQHSLNASSKLRSFALFRHQQSGYATEQLSWLLFRPLRMALVIILCRYKTKVSLPPLPAILPFLFGCRVGRVHRVLLQPSQSQVEGGPSHRRLNATTLGCMNLVCVNPCAEQVQICALIIRHLRLGKDSCGENPFDAKFQKSAPENHEVV